MKITSDLVSEAIALGKLALPKFTAVELAQILNIRLIDALKVIKANFKLFRFDAEKNILELDASNSSQMMNSTEVWNWYLKNRLGGVPTKCLPISDQSRLNVSVNSRIKWDTNFTSVAAPFASTEKTGSDVSERIASTYNAALAGRTTKLGVISGAGQVPDRYLFGVILTEDEVAARSVCGIPLYSSEWAMEEMLGEVDWVAVEAEPLNQVTAVAQVITAGSPTAVVSGPVLSIPTPTPAETKAETERKVNRRSKEQLQAERERMNTHLIDVGVAPHIAVKCFNIESFVEAEKFYKETLKAQVEGSKQEVLTEAKAEAPAAPVAPAIPVPETPAAPVESRRVSMPDMSALLAVPTPAKVPDIKADIRAQAGMPDPAPVAPTPVAPPVQPPLPPLAAPPVANPPPAGATASADDLLNSLLRQTGQT